MKLANHKQAAHALTLLHGYYRAKAQARLVRVEIIKFLVEELGVPQDGLKEKAVEVYLEGFLNGSGVEYVEEAA